VNHLQYDRVYRLHCGSQVMEAEWRETQSLRSIQAESAGKHPPCWNQGLKINTVPYSASLKSWFPSASKLFFQIHNELALDLSVQE
jgi:hypothetical protein